MIRLATVALLFAACNGSLPPAPAPPVPPAQPTPFVVGHWNLENPAMNEHLWIEADGMFTEAGGPPGFTAGSLSALLSSGTWTFAAPTLTLDDAQTGAHGFSAALVGQGDLELRQSVSSVYLFSRDAADASADR